MYFDLATDIWINNQERIFTISSWNNDVLEIDLHNGEVKYISRIPGEKIGFRDFSICVFFNGAIYCFPDRGQCIWKYDMNVKNWTRLEFGLLRGKRNSCRICSIIDETIILFSEGVGAILEFNCYKDELSIRRKIIFDTTVDLGIEQVLGNCIYFVTPDTAKIYIINFINGDVRTINISPMHKGVNTISVVGDSVFLTGSKQSIIEYSIINQRINEYSLYGFDNYVNKSDIQTIEKSHDKELGDVLFYAAINDKSSIWYIPKREGRILKFDTLTKKFEIVHGQPHKYDIQNSSLGHAYLVVYKDNDLHRLYLYSLCDSEYVEIDTEKNTYKNIEFGLLPITNIDCFQEMREETKTIGLAQLLHSMRL